jgi:hypothetical protein
MTHWWKSEVPHWLIGGINVALVAILAVPFVVPRSFVARHDTIDFWITVGSVNAILPAVLCSVWYLLRYRTKSRLFAAVAWITLAVCIGWIGLAFLLRRA